jgi:hypothetical protein
MEEEQYYRVLDGPQNQALRSDYDSQSCDVYPVADPNESTDIQRYARAEAIKQTIGMPGVDVWEATRRYLVGIKMEELDKLQPPRDPNNPQGPPPDPKMIEVQQRGQIEQARLQMDQQRSVAEFQAKQQKDAAELQLAQEKLAIEKERLEMEKLLNEAKMAKEAELQESGERRSQDIHEWDQIFKQEEADLNRAKVLEEMRLLKAQTIKTLADAEAAEAGTQIDQYKAWAEKLLDAAELVSQPSDQTGSEAPPIESDVTEESDGGLAGGFPGYDGILAGPGGDQGMGAVPTEPTEVPSGPEMPAGGLGGEDSFGAGLPGGATGGLT